MDKIKNKKKNTEPFSAAKKKHESIEFMHEKKLISENIRFPAILSPNVR